MTGMKLGRFEVLREIGKGAMGVVYLAHDPRIDRKIAIKMIAIPSGVSAEEAKEARHRFVREAQAAGKLAHPNIITIYDVVEDPEQSYIAMEYIDGETLEAHTKPGALLPLPKILSVVTQACSALDYAHKSQVIHRDIKPANLMLVKGELLKITDFGLAKKPDANLTQAGVLIGTPNYMSPEQISGKPMDGRSDFFSLGVVLYELLTGERPFGGDTISTIIYRILYDEPRPPRIINDKLPPALDQILKRALAKEPSERFQNGAEFADALNNYSTFHLKRPVSVGAPTLRVGREDATTPVLRPKEKARSYPRSVPAPATPLFAGQPFKVAAFIVLVVAGLVMFPRRVEEVSQDELRASRSPEARVDDSRAGFSVPGLGGPSAQPVKPPDSGREARVLIDPGTVLFLNGHPLEKPQIKLSESDPKEYQLLAVDGCRQRSTIVTVADLKDDYDMTGLQPAVGDLQIRSAPKEADIFLDGKHIGKTPHQLTGFTACQKHSFKLSLEGYREARIDFSESDPLGKISKSLAEVTLEKIPLGLARLEPAPPYPLEVTLVPQGAAKPKVVELRNGVMTLPEGKHKIVLKSLKVRFNRSIDVEVVGEKTQPLRVAWPPLGKLSVQAEPSNCKIYVDGEYLDTPPLHNHEIVAGEHKIEVVPDDHPDQKQTKTIVIEDGLTTVEKFTFAYP